MTVLTDRDIEEFVGIDRLIGSEQFQPAGIDLTVKSIEIFDEPGVIDFSNELRYIPRCTKLHFKPGEASNDGDHIFLEPGVYRVQVDPILEIPKDCVAFALPRSSLTRMGCSIQGAFWDSGYKGDAVFSLTVGNRLGVEMHRNARIAQIMFLRTSGNSDSCYEGTYQGHGIEG